MKILLIEGDSDYAACTFEEEMGIEKAKELIKEGKEINIETEESHFTGTVYEFGEVDEKFVNFVTSHIQDYDQSKHTNFYLLEK